MTPRPRPPAGPTPVVNRVLLAFIAHAGHATEDQITSYLGNVPAATVDRRIEDLRMTGMVTDSGTRREGWGRRPRILWKLTDKGRTRAATLQGPRFGRTGKMLALAALLAGLGVTGCGLIPYPSGCVRVAPHADAGQPIPGDWVYDGPTDSWWDPEDGFVGWALEEDDAIWRPTHRCAETDGAER
jgi:hypothetical protein